MSLIGEDGFQSLEQAIMFKSIDIEIVCYFFSDKPEAITEQAFLINLI
jgi:hypothetical protein